MVGGAIAIALFAVRQMLLMRTGAPLLDLRVLRHRTYRLSLILMSISFMAMLGAMILLPLYLQEVRGLSPLETGLLVMPGGLAMGLMGPRVGAAVRQVRLEAARAPRRRSGSWRACSRSPRSARTRRTR